ncbi:QueT transporter family protein [Sporosarcina aquimarina]|uniref:QueT transporter family protein n=1 Tax=Sporosarcina aquimarina TaxID=114975 RepID=UPI002041BB6C|nr:QueT transporter family protein [Sporosarcina aquimarina]MCM3755909.1 QueT transporter family protein [Sporosarcina aquimarina]
MKTKTLAVSGIIGALYVAVMIVLAPFGFTNIQFRLAEIFNHLVVFNKKYFVGIVIGVFVSNLLLSEVGPIDLLFGVGHTMISLSITIFLIKRISSPVKRMMVNTAVFTTTMCIISWQLHLVLGFPFWVTWGYLAISEFIVMAIGIPLMHTLNKRISLSKLI